MVWPAFENLAVECWVHPGKVGLSQPCLCLFHDAVDLGKPIRDALIALQDDSGDSGMSLKFRSNGRRGAIDRLKLIRSSSRDDLRVMSIQCANEVATIEMAEEGLALMIDAVNSWLKGAEDFCVSPRHSSLSRKQLGMLDRESGELWFWGSHYHGP